MMNGAGGGGAGQMRVNDNVLYDKRGRNSKGSLMFNYLGHNTQLNEGYTKI